MVSISKKAVPGRALGKRRSAKRAFEQRQVALAVEQKAIDLRSRFETSGKQERYAADFRLMDRLDGPVGEISYKRLGNKRLSVEKEGELTREHGIVRKIRTVFQRNLHSGAIDLKTYQRKGFRGSSSYVFDDNGKLQARQKKDLRGRVLEDWKREGGQMIRTRYVNKRRLGSALIRPVSEEMSAPYRSRADNRLYRKLTRRKGGKSETFERDDNGNLELVSSKSSFSSMRQIKAGDRKTSETYSRKLGGAFSKSHRSLLDHDGKEVARDILSHRRLFNKRSAVYDSNTGMLKRAKHSFGKLYKHEVDYINKDVKRESHTFLGVTVQRRYKNLSKRESNDWHLRETQFAEHMKTWNERFEEVLRHPAEKGRTESALANTPLNKPTAPIQEFVPHTKTPDSAGLEHEKLASWPIPKTFDAQLLFGEPSPARDSNLLQSTDVGKIAQEHELANILKYQPLPVVFNPLEEKSFERHLTDNPSVMPRPIQPDDNLAKSTTTDEKSATAEDRSTSSSLHGAGDLQALFGEPSMSEPPTLRFNFNTESNTMSETEKQALLREVVNAPLPQSLSDARSDILNRSANRDRSAANCR
ncbi:hypothetical protein [Rhizobium rhododendri]|uniref:VirA/G regulated protein n=1 Tax=Rhizobium rhododendri TaxID=2506430 RepID=A0ABY8IR17_9HYPH|nr:hypothetical protein [Rhizobium rhododendri]WFS26158.1 hypothetical protein PR018_26080 [Rhizobium rhododendri]